MRWDRGVYSKRSLSWSSSTFASTPSFSIQFGWQVATQPNYISLMIHISSLECQQSARRENIAIPRGGEGKGPSELSELDGTTGRPSSKPGWPSPDRSLPEVSPSMEKNPYWRGVCWTGSHLPKNNKCWTIPNELKIASIISFGQMWTPVCNSAIKIHICVHHIYVHHILLLAPLGAQVLLVVWDISHPIPPTCKFDCFMWARPDQTEFHNFNQISDFQPNFRISSKFLNFNQISQFWPNFTILTKFHNFDQISEFRPNFTTVVSILRYLGRNLPRKNSYF